MTEKDWWDSLLKCSEEERLVTYSAFADWLEEQERLPEARAFRWLVEFNKYPRGGYWDDANTQQAEKWVSSCKEYHVCGLPYKLFKHLRLGGVNGWYRTYGRINGRNGNPEALQDFLQAYTKYESTIEPASKAE